MTALEALQQARLDPSKYARVKDCIGGYAYKFIGGNPNQNWWRIVGCYLVWNALDSPVEWEVVSESEL